MPRMRQFQLSAVSEGSFAVMAADTHVVEVQGQLMLSWDQRAVVTVHSQAHNAAQSAV